jgi:alginate O-acetyltransferase complex protein AlgI
MGLFKKVLIADTLGEWASPVFANADKITFLEAWIGALAYTLQLYIDFSAYSEMAIGLGLMFNLRLPVNFNSPYQATSIIDFWRRWHMTLGDWVKNYLYIPMGGNRHGEWRKMRNLFVSMLIIGLWHGAGWTFVLWGGIHGVLLMLNHQWRRLNITLPHFVNWAMTFICVLVCWVIFRADNIQAAGDMLFTMVDIQHIALPTEIWCQEMFADSGIPFVSWHVGKDLQNSVISLTLLMIAVLKMKNPVVLLGDFRPNGKWFAAVLIMLLVALCQLNNYTEFLYFQF